MWQKWGTGNTVGGGARPGCSFNLRPGSGTQGYSPEDSVLPGAVLPGAALEQRVELLGERAAKGQRRQRIQGVCV